MRASNFSRPLADSHWVTATIDRAFMLALIACFVILAGIAVFAGGY
jgi:hypothetical protein